MYADDQDLVHRRMGEESERKRKYVCALARLGWRGKSNERRRMDIEVEGRKERGRPKKI